jgi:hypothetical protein
VACLIAAFGHGWPAVGALALVVGTYEPVVPSVEGSLAGSLVDEPKLGTAYGVLNGVNGVGDLVSSVGAGLLWAVNPAVSMLAGAALSLSAAAILWVRPPKTV